MMNVFIPFNTPSLKNSKPNGKFHSASVRKYLQKLGVKSFSSSRKEAVGYKTRPNLFACRVVDLAKHIEAKQKPVRMGFHFIRDSKRKFDYINAMQIILDLLTAHGVIEDDDCDTVIPYVAERFGKPYFVDKENAGCILEVE